jgi:hypothetical protein
MKCKICGKTSFDSEHEALQAAEDLPVKLRVYECPYGNGWHFSSKPKLKSTGLIGGRPL